jgi:hypothetical protein
MHVSLENPDLRREALDDPRGLLARHPQGAILDEVQRAPELLSYLQGDVDDRADARGRWILTGSHNLLLLKSVSQTLAGRTALLNLMPFGLDELPATWLATQPWTELALIGGYPAPLHRGIPTDVWLGDYVATYLDRDVRDVLRVVDLNSFERFVRLCAGRSGQVLNHGYSPQGRNSIVGICSYQSRPWRKSDSVRSLLVLVLSMRSMPRLSPAAPSSVSTAWASAAMSSSQLRRVVLPAGIRRRFWPGRRAPRPDRRRVRPSTGHLDRGKDSLAKANGSLKLTFVT